MHIKINLLVNRVIQTLLIFLFIVNAALALFGPFFAVFITSSVIGATLKTVGFATALYAITRSIIQIPLARKIDKKIGEHDDFYVMLFGSSIACFYALGLYFVHFAWQLYILSLMSGVGDACLMAAFYGIFARHIDKGSEGFEWSLLSVWCATLS